MACTVHLHKEKLHNMMGKLVKSFLPLNEPQHSLHTVPRLWRI